MSAVLRPNWLHCILCIIIFYLTVLNLILNQFLYHFKFPYFIILTPCFYCCEWLFHFLLCKALWITNVYEMCYTNKLALPCLAYVRPLGTACCRVCVRLGAVQTEAGWWINHGTIARVCRSRGAQSDYSSAKGKKNRSRRTERNVWNKRSLLCIECKIEENPSLHVRKVSVCAFSCSWHLPLQASAMCGFPGVIPIHPLRQCECVIKALSHHTQNNWGDLTYLQQGISATDDLLLTAIIQNALLAKWMLHAASISYL